MPSFQRRRGATWPRRQRGMPFPLFRSILLQALHFKRRRMSSRQVQNCVRSIFRLFTSTSSRRSPAELSAWVQIHLASKARQVPPALRGLFIFETRIEKREGLSAFVEDNWRLGTSTDPGRDPTAAVIEWFRNLHLLGFSLSGNFDITDFALDYSSSLRGERRLLGNLRKLTLNKQRKDMESCADMVEWGFYNRGYHGCIPAETNHLLWLLQNFKPRYSFLVCNHACLGNECHKIALFKILYNQLHVLEKIGKPKYNMIIGKIQCCIIPGRDTGSYLTEVLELNESWKEIADPDLLVTLQKALDDEGELAGLEWHRPNTGLQLLHQDRED